MAQFNTGDRIQYTQPPSPDTPPGFDPLPQIYQVERSLGNGEYLLYPILEGSLSYQACLYNLGSQGSEERSKWAKLSEGGSRKTNKSAKPAAKAPKGPQPSAQRVVVNGQKRVVYLGPKGGKYIKKGGEFVRL